MDLERIIEYTIEEEEVLVDMIRYLMEDMRSNAQNLEDVTYVVSTIKRMLMSIKYQGE